MKTKSIISKSILHIILIILSAMFLLPFIWMLSTALKSNEQVFLNPPILIPNPLKWSNFKDATEYIPFFRYFANTSWVAIWDILGTILICPLVAYGLSRLEWKGRDVLFFITIAVMMIPSEVTMIPTFIMYNKFNLVNTYVPLFIQSFFGRPFMIFLLRQNLMNLPKDLEDAARIDGASEITIYSKIVLPLIIPTLTTVGLFRLMSSWNDFMGPLLYLSDDLKYTLTIGLQMFTTQYRTEWPLLMAATILTSLPIMIIYFFVQKTFIEGVAFSGLKG